MQTLTLITNYQLLDYLGLLEPTNGLVKLPSDAVIFKGDITIPELPKSPVFTMDRLLNGVAFDKEELETALTNLPYLKHLRVFFGRFKDENERITQKAQLWDRIKAWRIDIDVVKAEDLVRDKEEANKRIDAKLEDILALIEDKKLPLAPNILKRSNRGWHLIYTFKEWITREAYERYLEVRNNPEVKPDDSITDQFTVFELLTKKEYNIATFISELEPQVDVGASSDISQIATRFITDDLPAYFIHEPYTLKEFREAFEFITDKWKDEEVVYKPDKTPYTIHDIPKETFLSLMDRCEVLKALDEDWENHGNYEWYVMTNYYAIRMLYAQTPQEAEEIRLEFHDKSRRWKGNGNKHYTYEEAEYNLNYYMKQQAEGLKPPTCKYIYHYLNPKYTSICLKCQYRKFDRNGNMISNFIFDGLKDGRFEDIHIPGWEPRLDGWYVYEAGKGEEVGRYVRAIGYFKIRNHFFVGDKEFISIVDERGISKIVPVERKKDSYKVLPTFIQQLYINPDKVPEINKFSTKYIEAVKERRGVVINFLGYRFINGSWDIAIGGDENYRRKDLGYLFYQQEIDDSWFVPSYQGKSDTFKAIYYQAFLLNDPPLHLVIAHYLSWIGEQYIETRSLKPQINPILILVGDTGTGKSVRAKIGAGLYGNPAVFSFTNITRAGLSNRFPMIKAPFAIDEVMTKSKTDEEELGKLLYNIGNKTGKMNAYATHGAIDVPILLTGETENFLIDKLFASYRGLNRRSIVIKMTKEWRDNSDILDMILDELHDHCGYINSYVKSLNTKDKELITEEAQKIYDRIELTETAFKEIRKHLAVSLATFKHFYKSFIGFNLSDEEIDSKIDKVIKFTIKEMAEHQLNRIGDNIDYEEEVIEFISSVKKAQKSGETLKGMSFKGVKNKIDYRPSNKMEELLKKFFWKKYPRPNKPTTVDYHFRDNNLLLTYPNHTQEDINDTAEKITELSKDELVIWLRVAERLFGKAGVEKIKGLLLGSAYGKELRLKFQDLLTTLEPQPQPEPEVDF